MVNYPQYVYPSYQQYPYMLPQNSQSQGQQNQSQSQTQAPQNPPIRNNGFILVSSEEEAYRYPVALGNCVTCKVENEPIVIEKSMSFSQLDNPRIDRYRLVREDVVDAPKAIEEVIEDKSMPDDLKDELASIREELAVIKKRLFSTNNKPVAKKREVDEDE